MPGGGLQQVVRVRGALFRSEGSLNQHLKIKHPDIFRSLSNYLSGAHIVKESDEEDDSM